MPLFRKYALSLVMVLWVSSWVAAETGQSTTQSPAAQPNTPAKKTTARKHKKTAEQPALPPYQPHTLSQLPLEQVPAVPPEVDYTAGQLTIIAHNSTLGDILRAVHKQTGAELEIPPNATERVVASLGPGPARDVLATLLNGTHFNYVMLGSAGDPTSVQRVVLTSKTGPETTVASSGPPAGMPPNRFQQFQQPVPQAQNNGEGEVAEDPPAEAQDDNAEAPADDQGDQQADQGNPGQAPKTPEQLLQELQRQQQQMQQQQPNAQPGQPQIVYPNPPNQVPPADNQN